MVVSRDYMLKLPNGPSAPKLFLDTKLVPAVVNALGGAEVALDRTSRRTGLSGRVILGSVAAVVSIALCGLLFRHRVALKPSSLPDDVMSPAPLIC